MNKNDKRYIQTEELILKVFYDLVYEKGFDRVTVKDITKDAGISRGAFYIHYEDKYDLLSHCENTALNELKLISYDMNKLENAPSEEDFKYFFTKIICYYRDNYKLAKSLLDENRNSELQEWIKNNLGNNIFNFYCKITGKDKLPISREYLSSYLYYAHLGIISEWFNCGMKEPPEKIAEIITKLSFNGVFNL
ncbi:transcriptional regulator, TetR family [Clostridium pasteurianum DSM 525 = ATCC 6013]|uniref:Transcriptional regulator, TetR family n=1 Tax=Clostridium pasteurianum DSM 525 = ATCC 6013 TaxID=1262449 RepID=A0A0H3IY98_CLOPA|nr:TetR/AcrR family transcriptional regulator [Clostridium pasteurianum]AJA46476.1 transcriptional regulator, TetR family [Clostridium pasteurianum DSM 525 = ATCC 6013]AJA50464.1 transcriptional regulator, TetR family [Clostridium pasteurianum DSM 525 = ATCC 6013]AOZ73906.1 transcriptional regulator [Clostridium pasteurianum DSM 525 = ATCC 6013]AOZ77703.1 transcriptional regulator [Clostridium pasteurianum]ELP61051.1 transcriptional regulator [Clostridium pasteurianum DSM 525 = ATCC 6013]